MSDVEVCITRMPVRGAAPSCGSCSVGRISTPPLATAAVPATTCSGVTEMPWPKPMVSVRAAFHSRSLGTIGAAASGSSIGTRLNMPIWRSHARCRSVPAASAMWAAPILDE